MKVVINTCFGGFSLSPAGVAALAARRGRTAYFFKQESPLRGAYIPITIEEAAEAFMFYAFDIPNPNEVLPDTSRWGEMSQQERQASNDLYAKHSLEVGRGESARHDPDLVAVVEELGGGYRTGASGRHAELTVVEIPDGIEYEIEECDGNEHVAEKHRTWR